MRQNSVQAPADGTAWPGQWRVKTEIKNRKRQRPQNQNYRNQRRSRPDRAERPVQQQPEGPADEQSREQEARKPQGLPEEIGEYRPIAPEKVMRRRVDRRVQRRIMRVVSQQ